MRVGSVLGRRGEADTGQLAGAVQLALLALLAGAAGLGFALVAAALAERGASS